MTTPLLPAFVSAPEVNRVYHLDALELMRALPEKSVDAIITDLPYGTTACSWDTIIPFEPMWAGIKRVLKPRGVFVTTASQPFTSKLVCSNLDWFKEEVVWNKVNSANGMLADIQHMKIHENVLIFSACGNNYFPQMIKTYRRIDKVRNIPNGEAFSGGGVYRVYDNRGLDYPKTIVTYSNADQTNKQHPTQKPIGLCEYLIRSYTQPGELVLDFCCGSGTTAVAARNLNRCFIAGDITLEYVEIARKRLAEPYTLNMFERQEAAS